MLNTALSNALDQRSIRAFFAVQIELPNYTINLIDGSGAITFGGHTFTGYDPVYGALDEVSPTTEAIATSAPTFSFKLLPPSENAIGGLAAPANQGAPVRAWFGVVNELTGQTIGTPELLWHGRFDTATINVSENSQSVDVMTVSAYDRFFASEEGERLNASWHTKFFPGETGLDQITQALQSPWWGAIGPGGATAKSGGGYSGGGSTDNAVFDMVRNVQHY